LKPSFCILLICYIYGTLPVADQDVWAPPFGLRIYERAEALGSRQSNFYFIKTLF